MHDAPQPDRLTAYTDLVDSMLDRVHRHVRLVYPYASTRSVVTRTFRMALEDRCPDQAPGTLAWLFGLARTAVHADASDSAGFQCLNAAAVLLGVREIAEGLTGAAQHDAIASIDALGSLSCADQDLLRLYTIEDELRLVELAWILKVDVVNAEAAIAAACQRLRAALAANSHDRLGWEIDDE